MVSEGYQMKIIIVDKAEPWILEGLNALLPQLSDAAPCLSPEEFRQIVVSDCTTVLAALEHREVVGSLTLVVFRIPTCVRARIEDVVVAASVRGRGIGESLMRHAMALAKSRGAAGIDLTSSPARSAANRLYRKIGFVPRQTNTYRFTFA